MYVCYNIYMSNRPKSWTKSQFVQAVKNNHSVAGVLRDIGLKAVGGNYKTVKNYIEEYNLDTSHFTGQGWNVNNKANLNNKMPLSEALVENSPYKSTSNLKRRLVNEGLLEYKCNVCGIATWLGKEISLHLDHVNGVNNDNRIENLRLLCPNCHSQTSTYCGKNIEALYPNGRGNRLKTDSV